MCPNGSFARYLVLTTAIFLTLGLLLPAQREGPNYDEGTLGLAFALRKIPQTGSFLHITAHPDDEDNPLLVMLSRGRGVRTGLLTLTRGAGGQNEIGPELFEALALLRTGELMSVHRYDGARQFFTRAYDFGYSFSVEETIRRWGREEILADIVRVIRTFHPDIITILPRTGEGGGQHHQASARLAAEAFRAAGNPRRFPDQLSQGLRPWQSKKLYERVFWGNSAESDANQVADLTVQAGVEDPLLGRSYFEIGMQARSLHRCQGMAQVVPVTTQNTSYWNLVDSTILASPNESDFFDGIDTSLRGIESYVGQAEDSVPFLRQALEEIQNQARIALEVFHSSALERTARPLAKALEILRTLRSRMTESDLQDETKYQIDFLLNQKEEDLVNALVLARQLRLESSVRDGLVEPGQSFELETRLINGGKEPITVRKIAPKLPEGWKVEAQLDQLEKVPAGGVLKRIFDVTVSPEAEFTEPYWTRESKADRYQVIEAEHSALPWSPSPVFVETLCETDGTYLTLRQPTQFRYEGRWVGGEQQHDLLVVPRVSVTVQPKISVIPLDQSNRTRVIRVTTTYQAKTLRSGSLRLEVPVGWKVSPTRTELSFQHEGQSVSHKFRLTPPPDLRPGQVTLKALAELDGNSYSQGYQVIDYHHIQKRHLYHPAEITVKVINAKVLPNLKLGYVMGVGDKVPEALTELGVDFQLLSDEDLAFSDLGQYGVIMTGVRAYLSREQLQVQNQRLLEWVRAGGTMIVQYNKFEFNKIVQVEGERRMKDSPYAPYPVRVGRGRVTDETAKVVVLDPTHPVFSFPNRITILDWNDWVQERGLYFLDEKDTRYRDLVSMEDPFEYNRGEQTGALVIARYGRGKWLYVGLGLWRQLPAGVTGAYRLLANLVSLGSQD